VNRTALGLLAFLLAVMGAFVAGHHGGVKAGQRQVQVRWDAETIRLQDAAIKEAEAVRENERKTAADQMENANEADRLQARSMRALPRLVAAGDGLRYRTAAVAAACDRAAQDPGVAAAGPAASSPGDLLADVQRRMGAAAADVVGFADDASIAGALCAANYDALKGRQ